MAKAVKLFSGFTMDYSSDKMAAVTATGAVFTRTKVKHPKYGYGWSAWKHAATVPHGMTEMDPNGPCINHNVYFKNGVPNVKLPN